MLNLRKDMSGISLIAVLVATAITGILIVAVNTLLSNQIKTQNHLNIQDDLRSARLLIEKRLSCSKTLSKEVLDHCSRTYALTSPLPQKIAQPQPYIILRDQSGAPLGSPGDDYTTRVGRWTLRASCVNNAAANLFTIMIYRARFEKSGKNFLKDPLTGNLDSWAPLYNSDSPQFLSLCSETIAPQGVSSAEHLISSVLDERDPTGCSVGLMSIPTGGIVRRFEKTINCPEGKIAIGGGAKCDQFYQPHLVPGIIGSLFKTVTNFVQSPTGSLIASNPANNGQGWYVSCCAGTGANILVNAAPMGYAVCVKSQ